MNKFKVVVLVLVILWVTGCSGYNAAVCYEGVKAKYPNAEIAMIPGEKYRFLVKTSEGNILYIETMNFSDGNVTQEFVAFHNK